MSSCRHTFPTQMHRTSEKAVYIVSASRHPPAQTKTKLSSDRAGRGFPDVAANGAQLLFYNDKRLEPTYGTSLSTPIFASIITLINEERTKAGKSPVGFINPVIYQHPEVFDDIKVSTIDRFSMHVVRSDGVMCRTARTTIALVRASRPRKDGMRLPGSVHLTSRRCLICL